MIMELDRFEALLYLLSHSVFIIITEGRERDR